MIHIVIREGFQHSLCSWNFNLNFAIYFQYQRKFKDCRCDKHRQPIKTCLQLSQRQYSPWNHWETFSDNLWQSQSAKREASNRKIDLVRFLHRSKNMKFNLNIILGILIAIFALISAHTDTANTTNVIQEMSVIVKSPELYVRPKN